jgi:hypothetical protein
VSTVETRTVVVDWTRRRLIIGLWCVDVKGGGGGGWVGGRLNDCEFLVGRWATGGLRLGFTKPSLASHCTLLLLLPA